MTVETKLLGPEEPVDLNHLAERLKKVSPEAGALVIYVGFVKGVVEGRRVERLDYEIYEEYTERRMRIIAEDIMSRDPRVKALIIYHRKGSFTPGEDVVYIGVAATTRSAAFQAARQAIDRVKHETGIWKIERRENGAYWVLGEGRRVKSSKTGGKQPLFKGE